MTAAPERPTRPCPPSLAGTDPTVVRDEIIGFVRRAITNRPRDLQKEIGPSGLGHPCDRHIGYVLADHPPLGYQRPPWRQAVGSAVDDAFKGWADNANEQPWHDSVSALTDVTGGRDEEVVQRFLDSLDQADASGGRRWWTDLPAPVGELYPGRTVMGTLDLYDAATAGVIDLKGLAVTTPIPTPTGWSTMGDVAVGEQVLGADGRPVTVVAKSRVRVDRPCYRVTFNDGASVVTDNVHLWRFRVGAKADRDVIMSTEDAARQVRNPDDPRNQRHLRVLNPAPLDLPTVDLPVAPYVLGAWLGDGETESGRISKPDLDLFRFIGESYDVHRSGGRDNCPRYRIVGLTAELRAAGVLGDKHIPAAYLRASLEQRLDLLRGLMDTDGGWNRARNAAAYSSVDKALAHQVGELVRTFGWKANIAEYTAHGFGKTVTAYRVEFVPYDLNPFRLPRKANLVRLAGSAMSRHRVVRSIEQVPHQPTQCIAVDAADSLYLCGDRMIPTHNTPGPTQMKKHRGGTRITDEQYRTQVHAYATGIARLGWRVDWVAVLRLPANGELDDATWQWEPHDPAVAPAALNRVGAIARLVDALGVAAAAHLPTADHYCRRCPWQSDGATDPSVACPGHPGFDRGFEGRDRSKPPAAMQALIAPTP